MKGKLYLSGRLAGGCRAMASTLQAARWETKAPQKGGGLADVILQGPSTSFPGHDPVHNHGLDIVVTGDLIISPLL